MKTPLSITAINNARIEKTYNIESFVLNMDTWANIDPKLSVYFAGGNKFKFDENITNHLSTNKGIYIFYVEPDFPFSPATRYLMYVGKVTGTNTFKNRFYSYVNAIGNINEKENIMILTNLWPGKTWVYVYPLNMTDKEIEAIENNLIDNIVPPLNSRVKSKSAKNSRSIFI